MCKLLPTFFRKNLDRWSAHRYSRPNSNFSIWYLSAGPNGRRTDEGMSGNGGTKPASRWAVPPLAPHRRSHGDHIGRRLAERAVETVFFLPVLTDYAHV